MDEFQAPGNIALLADIGATHARFALASTEPVAPLRMDSVRVYPAANFASLDAAAAHYLRETGTAAPRRGVFAIAGRVQGDAVNMTNRRWTISLEQTRRALALDTLRIGNDFALLAMCLPLLAFSDILAIGPGEPALDADGHQNLAVLGPGTGLGVAGLLLREGRMQVLETEGGHLGFAPQTQEEIEILQRLAQRFGRVSNERLISGPGLVNLYQALCQLSGIHAEPLRPEDISERAAQGHDPVCGRAMRVFADILGSIAGDLVLTLGAWEGVYLAGGMLPALLPWLEQGGFRQRFEDKGRYSQAMASVPVRAILHPQAGLLGAAAAAIADAHIGLAPGKA